MSQVRHHNEHSEPRTLDSEGADIALMHIGLRACRQIGRLIRGFVRDRWGLFPGSAFPGQPQDAE